MILVKPPPRTPIEPNHPINESLVGAWLLGDGGVGELWDSSPNRRHGALSDSSSGFHVSKNPWERGKLGGRAFRSYAPGSLLGESKANYTPPTGNFSVGIWFNATSFPAFSPVICQWNDGTPFQWALSVATNGDVYAYSSSNSADWSYRLKTGVVVRNRPVFLMATYPPSGGTVILYVDGVAQTTTLGGTQAYLGIHGQAQHIYFAWSPAFAGAATAVNGSIEMARMWSRLVTPSEVDQLYRDQFLGFQREHEKRKIYSFAASAASIPPTFASAFIKPGRRSTPLIIR